MSGRAVEASGDVDVILLDKTGTITFGNRLASAIVPAAGCDEARCWRRRCVASLHDETPEGRSIVVLARQRLAELARPAGDGDDAGLTALDATIADDSATSRPRRAPAASSSPTGRPSSRAPSTRSPRRPPAACLRDVTAESQAIAGRGATPLAIRERPGGAGLIELKDTVKPGLTAAIRGVPPDGHPDGDGHGRQPAAPPRPSPARRASTTSLPRPSPRTRSASSARSRPRATSWR